MRIPINDKGETVRKLLLIVLAILLAGGFATASAAAKGVGQMPSIRGVTVNGSPYRYSAMSPHARGNRRTVIAQTNRRGGRVSRWWSLRGEYYVPAVASAYEGGGLSADGSTLVLSRFNWGYPPKETRFAILNTRHRPYRGPWWTRHQRRAFSWVDLKGDFSFDAISPDGSTAYLIHRYLPASAGEAYITTYEVRALDLESGKLLPRPIVDPEEPDEKMQGRPLSRATSPDGRWAYTLYDGDEEEMFIHALDTVEGRAVCIDLPQLENLHQRFYYLLYLQTVRNGRELVVMRHRVGPPPARQILAVDTQSFDVQRPEQAATASSAISPWPLIGLGLGCLILGFSWRLWGRRETGER
jgi:hypothetical protein